MTVFSAGVKRSPQATCLQWRSVLRKTPRPPTRGSRSTGEEGDMVQCRGRRPTRVSASQSSSQTRPVPLCLSSPSVVTVRRRNPPTVVQKGEFLLRLILYTLGCSSLRKIYVYVMKEPALSKSSYIPKCIYKLCACSQPLKINFIFSRTGCRCKADCTACHNSITQSCSLSSSSSSSVVSTSPQEEAKNKGLYDEETGLDWLCIALNF